MNYDDLFGTSNTHESKKLYYRVTKGGPYFLIIELSWRGRLLRQGHLPIIYYRGNRDNTVNEKIYSHTT